jgi:hypothetical protein
MFGKWRQRRVQAAGVELCESCGQVCTASCRARARVEQMRVQVAYQAASLR